MSLEYDELSVALSYAILLGGSAPAAASVAAAPAAAAAPAVAKKEAAAPAKPAAKADDFDDLFGDDEAPAPVPAKKDAMDDMFMEDDEDATEEEKAATKARLERMANARKLKEEKDLKDGKKKVQKEAERSLIVLEVKPWEADTDLKMVWEKICEYKQEGLVWGATFKLEPVAYGIMKLVMTCTIVDALVLLDDITENIESHEDYVQSVTVASFNKI